MRRFALLEDGKLVEDIDVDVCGTSDALALMGAEDWRDVYTCNLIRDFEFAGEPALGVCLGASNGETNSLAKELGLGAWNGPVGIFYGDEQWVKELKSR